MKSQRGKRKNKLTDEKSKKPNIQKTCKRKNAFSAAVNGTLFKVQNGVATGFKF